jgi:hypothetical protein
MLETAIVASFTFFNTARLVSYIPQLLVIARDRNGATAVSYLTWTIWVCANVSASAYAGMIARDLALCFIYAMNGFFCLLTVAFTAYKRWQWRCEQSKSNSSDAAVVAHYQRDRHRRTAVTTSSRTKDEHGCARVDQHEQPSTKTSGEPLLRQSLSQPTNGGEFGSAHPGDLRERVVLKAFA